MVDLHLIIREFLTTPEFQKILSFHPQVRVKTRLGAKPSRLMGSAVHLQKAVMNLVSNAAEAQKEEGVIEVATETRRLEAPVGGYDQVRPGEYLRLSVQDRGHGIDPGDLQRIFEPFFTKKVMGRSGTGLGMTVVWGTVQDHDGYIEVASTPGEGTRFDLYFPVVDAPMEIEKAPVEVASLTGNGERILVVDDDESQRKIAGEIFKRLGYGVDAVESGEVAVACLKERDFDLVLLDMMMPPGIDGLETLRRIRAFKPDQKVIIASGFSREHQAEAAMELGVLEYVKKPYSIEKIGTAARNALG